MSQPKKWLLIIGTRSHAAVHFLSIFLALSGVSFSHVYIPVQSKTVVAAKKCLFQPVFQRESRFPAHLLPPCSSFSPPRELAHPCQLKSEGCGELMPWVWTTGPLRCYSAVEFVQTRNLVCGKGRVLTYCDVVLHQAVALKETYEREDEIDDAAEEAEETRHEQERAAAKALAKPKPLDEGGGLYFYERVYWGTRDLLYKLLHFASPSSTSPRAESPAALQGPKTGKGPL